MGHGRTFRIRHLPRETGHARCHSQEGDVRQHLLVPRAVHRAQHGHRVRRRHGPVGGHRQRTGQDRGPRQQRGDHRKDQGRRGAVWPTSARTRSTPARSPTRPSEPRTWRPARSGRTRSRPTRSTPPRSPTTASTAARSSTTRCSRATSRPAPSGHRRSPTARSPAPTSPAARSPGATSRATPSAPPTWSASTSAARSAFPPGMFRSASAGRCDISHRRCDRRPGDHPLGAGHPARRPAALRRRGSEQRPRHDGRLQPERHHLGRAVELPGPDRDVRLSGGVPAESATRLWPMTQPDIAADREHRLPCSAGGDRVGRAAHRRRRPGPSSRTSAAR